MKAKKKVMQKSLTTDVIVVAAGTAGMAAAVTAAEYGAEVVVFEKTNHVGGTANIARAIFAVESRLQRQKMFTLSKDEAFKLHMDYTHWQVDARLVRAHIDKSADTIAWLEKMGVRFDGPYAYYPGSFFTEHTIARESNVPVNTSAAVRALNTKAQELGVRFFLKTPVKKIIKEKGRITGILAEDENGNEIQVQAKAVIIATGGFGNDSEWIKKYTSINPELISGKMPGGEGVHMAWEVGAGRTQMTIHVNDGIAGIFRNTPLIWASFRQPNLMVNLLGERFVNEEIINHATFMGNALLKQKKACGFMIYDEPTRQYYAETNLESPQHFIDAENKHTTLDSELAQLLESKSDAVIVAESIEELAGKTGINPDSLRQTVDEYNSYCKGGHDGLFNKNQRYLRPVRTPKYYAAKYVPGAFGTLGGIKINYKTEVMTDDFEVIPGLYAAGSDSNSLYGDSYILMMPGNTMGFALNSGRIAGENATKFALERKNGPKN